MSWGLLRRVGVWMGLGEGPRGKPPAGPPPGTGTLAPLKPPG